MMQKQISINEGVNFLGTIALLCFLSICTFSMAYEKNKIIFYGFDFSTTIFLVMVLINVLLMYHLAHIIIGNNSFDMTLIFLCMTTFWLFALLTIRYQNSDLIVAGATVVLVLATGYNIHQTRVNAELTRYNEIVPLVIPKVIHKNKFKLIELILRNYGKGTAQNIKISVQPEYVKQLSAIPKTTNSIFDNGIDYLPSYDEKIIAIYYPIRIKNSLKKMFGEISGDEKKLNEKSELFMDITIQLTYYDSRGKNYDKQYYFNLNEDLEIANLNYE